MSSASQSSKVSIVTRFRWACVWLCCSSLSLVGFADAPRPNVLLIVSDDQRPDTIAALGNSVIQTPNLDRLVRRGSVFTRAICANPICTPSRAELITGCTGLRNGVFDSGKRSTRN